MVPSSTRAEFDDVTVDDALDDYAMLAVQGPEARDAGRQPRQRRAAQAVPHRQDDRRRRDDVLIAGTGYTGEDGVELLLPPQGATAVWDALTAAGAAPIGLGARDTLRLEVCFHLYGNDLSEDRNPIEAGLGWCCKEATGFIGADVIAQARENGTAEKLVPFALTGPGIARQGNPIAGGGEVTSGTLSPCLDYRHRHGLPADRARPTPGTPFEIDVRGKPRTAEVREKPLYRKE